MNYFFKSRAKMKQTDQGGQEVNMCPTQQGVCPHFYVFCKESPGKSTDAISVGGTMNIHKPPSPKQVEELFKANTLFEETPQQNTYSGPKKYFSTKGMLINVLISLY